MPTSARKSSIGALRRIQPRAHLPFRADDLGRGKKTGLPVPIVQHGSDEFEPFDEILSQANTGAWHGQRNRPGSSNKRKSVAPIQEDGDGDEMSMELDDYGTARSINGRPPSSSPLNRRAGSSMRRAGVDFDELPSPRPRKSLISSMRRSSIGSPLHSAYVPPDFPDDEPFDADDGGGDIEMDAEVEDSASRGKSSKQQAATRRGNTSDDDDDDDDVPRAQSKGKARMETQDEDDVVEEEISRGLSDVDMQQDEDEEIEEPPPKKPPKEKGPRKKRELPEAPLSPENTTGVRRGKRLRYEPLEWWRCEKVVYGKRDPGKRTYVPTIKEIVRIPKEPSKPLGAAHRKRRHTTPRSKSEVVVATDNPEEGWDDKTQTNGVVIDWFTGSEVSRRLAFPGRLVGHRPAANNDFFFTKVFGDGEYIAAGQLKIPPHKHKPSKMTKDNTYVFYVIEGAVTFKVHESSYVLCSGGMILVPRGNTYYIQNIAERDAKLFFAQARRVSADEEAPPEVLPAMDAETTATPQRRPSNSAGQGPRRSDSAGQAPTTARFSSERAPPAKKRAASTRA
ncbi:Mif2/CENP-C like-domain-containing protein [Lactarius quietus]|nr:Mif2/CENP-C like-domain-containing protein [Lactarius quietus]